MFAFNFFGTDSDFLRSRGWEANMHWFLKGRGQRGDLFLESTRKDFWLRCEKCTHLKTLRFLEAFGGSRDSREESVQGCVCDPLIPQGNQYRNLDQFFLNCHHVPTNFAKNRVSVPKKLNPNIKRSDLEAKRSQKKCRKGHFQVSLWTLNLKNFPNRGAALSRRASDFFLIEGP